MNSMKRIAFPLLSSIALIAGMALMACDNDDNDDGTTVDVSLVQFAVTPDRMSAPDGDIRFRVTNNGTVTHEFVVIRTELAPNALPTEANGSYMENGPGTSLIDEIEDIAPGQTVSLELDLPEGNYVLICNMVGPAGAHYALGMRVRFTVT